MATTFTRFVWPPLIFPLPTFIGGGKYANFILGARPPQVLPSVLAARTSLVATPAAPPMPSMVAPTPLRTGAVTFTPAAPPAIGDPSKIVPPATTQAQINDFFHIVNGTSSVALQNPGPIESPPPPVNPGGQ